MAFILLLIYQCIYLLRPFEWGAGYNEGGLPYAILAMLGSLTCFIFQKTEKNYSPQFILALALCVVIILSGIANQWIGAGLYRAQLFLLAAVLPIFLYSNIINTNQKKETLMWVFIISALIMLTNGISQRNAVDGIGWAGSKISLETRITYLGILQDPNDLAGFFVLCLPFAAFFSVHANNFLLRLAGKLSVASMLYGIYLSNSRGALIATLTMTGAYILYRYGRAKSLLLGFMSLPLLAFIISNFRSIDASESSAEGRLEAWYIGFQMLKANPVLGVGAGNFLEYNSLTAHNTFVLVMSELGILGYALWFSMVGLSFYMLYKIVRYYQTQQSNSHFKKEEHTELTRALAINSAFFFSILGYATTAFFLSRAYNFLTYFICAIAIASYQHITTLNPELKFSNINSELKKLMLISIASILGLNILVRVLL